MNYINRDKAFQARFLRQARSQMRLSALSIGLAACYPALGAPPLPGTLPTGAVVSGGQAALSQNGSAMTVTQQSTNAVIDWTSFNVGSGASVVFHQPGAASTVLNRVAAGEPSQIFGTISANGRVFIVNPSGILFGAGSRVDTGGLVASSMAIGNADFMGGRYRFNRAGATGTVENQGMLSAASGGFVALLAPTVRNGGTIAAPGGSVALAAGDAVTLDIGGAGLLGVSVDAASIDTLIDNQGLIVSAGGQVTLSAAAASNALAASVSNGGAIEASALVADGGTIRLEGSAVQLQAGSRIEANGDGGKAELISTGSIGIDGTMEARGGNVVLRADSQGTGAGTVNFGGGGSIALGGTGRASIYYNPAGGNYAAPTSYAAYVNGGSLNAAMLVNTAAQLQAMQNALGGSYALGRDIDASATASWNGGAGFVSIGSTATPFSGSFDGLGRTISGLTINRPGLSYIGLFGTSTGSIGNVALAGGSIAGRDLVGALVGQNRGSISGVTSSAAVTGHDSVGGLAGASTGTISNASASGNVAGNDFVGGLLGDGDSVILTDVAASGTVTASGWKSGGLVGQMGPGGRIDRATASGAVISSSIQAGGLVGNNQAAISNATASNSVSGVTSVGGLVGINSATISGSHATGVVSGANDVGGLVGNNTGSLNNVHATGSVTSTSGTAGGLAGNTSGSISNAYATGDVSSQGVYAGGLAGQSSAAISDSYATGTVAGYRNVGGLVGKNTGNITASHAEGAVSGQESVGGLAGSSEVGTVTNAYASGNVSSVILNASASAGYLGGLVGYSNSSIANAHATGDVTSTTNYVGGLTGTNLGTIRDSYATGKASGAHLVGGLSGHNSGSIVDSHASGAVNGRDNTGGLVGNNNGSGSISHAYATGTVSSTGWYVGGLVGIADGNSSIDDAYATGTVQGTGTYYGGLVGVSGANTSISNAWASNTVSADQSVGGLIGRNGGTLTSSYATGAVSGRNRVGGLLGETSGTVSDVHATGSVTGAGTGATNVGGLVGHASGGSITRAYAKGNVTGVNGVNYGGFAGLNGGSISIAYATGAVTANQNVGGLVGTNNGSVSDSYAKGAVNGATGVGGFVGANGGTIARVHGDGAVTGGTNTGGLAGVNTGTVTASFWDIDTTGRATSAAGTGMSHAQMITAANFTSATAANGNINPGWDLDNIWHAEEVIFQPRLRAMLRTVDVTLNGDAKTYDGVAYSGGTGYSYNPSFLPGDTAAVINGTLRYVGNAQGAVNAGSYAISGAGLYAENYLFNYIAGTLTVDKKALGVTAVDKVYDGSSAAPLALTGLVGDQTLALDATVMNFDDKNAGSGKTVTVTGLRLVDGSNGGLANNYTVVADHVLEADVSARALTVGATGHDKIYDGTTAAIVTLGDDRVTGDALDITYASAAFADKNASSGKSIAVGGISMTGADAGNYTLAATGTSATADITRRTLTVGATGSNKVYDGNTDAMVTLTDNRVTGDVLDIGYSAAFGDKNAANGKTVTVAGMSLSDTDAGNYTLASTSTTATADITRRTLTVTASGNDKVYDGTTEATVAFTDNRVAGDVLNIGYSAAFSDKNAGNGKTVTVADMSLSDTDAGNYTLASTATTVTAGITPRPLAISAIGYDKTYDGTTAAQAAFMLSGFVGDERVTATLTGAAFSDARPGNGKTVYLYGIRLADGANGGLASNYLMEEPMFTVANIFMSASHGLPPQPDTRDVHVRDKGSPAALQGGRRALLEIQPCISRARDLLCENGGNPI